MQLKKVIELLEWKSETKTVAVIVHGIPGMGKTTLADAVFSTIFQQNYTSTNICRYSKIRLCEDKKSSLSTITTLQKTIRDYLVDHDDQRSAHISTFEDGQRQIGNILKKKSVFLCIDNVLNKERLDQLLPLRSTLDQAKKLRLLITARDKGIGTVLGHNMSCKFHEVLASSSSQAEKILKKHMDTKKLDKGLVDDIVRTSGGVPLILSVLGQSIGAEKDKQRAWRIFREERESWSGEIFDRLDIAYKHLPDDLKDPFLDICSFFNSEWYWEAVEDIVGISILDRLQKRGLLTKDLNSMLTIHDVILRIGLQRSKGSRIMDANEISQLDGKGIKGLWFTTDQGREPIPAKKLDQVARSLRILALQNLKVEGDYNENFPELIYLNAGMNPLPSNVSAFKKLSYLSYSPQKPEDLNLSQMPSKMKRLKLNGKSYSRLFRRCSLDLHGLQNLRVLKLLEFKHLTKLPKEFAFLKCLQELQIIDCDGFEGFPTDLGDLNQMVTLTIEKCPKLRKLPESVSKLTSLQILKLPHCAGLRQLPEDFGSLSSLRTLDLKGTGLKMLPSSFAQLSSLRSLYLSSCNKLDDLSKDFHSLPSLQYLKLSSCPMLQGQWMDVIKKVKTIKEVDIRKSEKLLQKWQGITDPPRTFSVKVN